MNRARWNHLRDKLRELALLWRWRGSMLGRRYARDLEDVLDATANPPDDADNDPETS